MAAGGGDAVRERVCERVEADSQPTMSQMCNIDTAWIHDRYVVGCAEVLQFVVVCCCLYLVSLDDDITILRSMTRTGRTVFYLVYYTRTCI